MVMLPSRRFKKFYERVLLSRFLAFILGWVFSVALPTLVYWGRAVFESPGAGQKAALIATTVAFVIMHYTMNRLVCRFPGGRTSSLLLAQVLAVYGLVFVVTLMLRVEVSRMLLVVSGCVALLWFQVDYLLTRTYFRPKLAIISGGLADELLFLPGADARLLGDFDLGSTRYDGVVADFEVITDEAQRFIAHCALNEIPVYNANFAYEALTGRVKINKMSENHIGALLPSPSYEFLKTLLEWFVVILTLPFTLFVGGLAAILIRLESPGSVIYTQTRIGKGNRPFTLYKLRSMRESTDEVESFAGVDDQRVTKVGRIIRKLRIDELPQLLNVLKGDMSLIGPRPEQRGFVDDFDAKIPFYTYRHVVKPGITGWAQVKQGYTDDASAAQEKLEYDFYYIKHRSLTLDLLIVFLTIRTMVTGFGAR